MEASASSFGETLRRLRVAAALSQEELAARSGLSARGISDLERGVRKGPRLETLRRLADALVLTTTERETLFAAAQSDREAPASTSPTQPPSLPSPGGPLFGRDEERAGLLALLRRSDVRLVTITGTGGCGKTHLALDVVSRLRDEFPHGIVFVDLSPLSEPDHVLPAVATTLGITDARGQPILATITAALRAKRVLLVLDNCEQLLEATPDLAALLASCPDMTVLATSREALRLRSEREWPLAPLPLPDLDRIQSPELLLLSPSVSLFVARAVASDPRFALTIENARAVATACHRVDGIPLAIELAAARVKLLTPQELASRLDQRLPLLTGGPRDAPPRQRTLRDAIAWSYDLLPTAERRLFRQLGVFAGGWTLAAAEAVVSPHADSDVLGGLGSLIDKSLVRVDERGEESRYAMFETVREFAAELLEREGESQSTRARHAEYFLALAERGARALAGHEQKRWSAILEREHPNLREAFRTLEHAGDEQSFLRLANALSFFWFFHTHAFEGMQRLARALDHHIDDPEARAATLLNAALLAYGLGDYQRAALWLEEGRSLADSLGAKSLIAQGAICHGAFAEHQGDEMAATASFALALTVAREINDIWLVGEVLPNLSDAAYRAGDLDLAERYALEAIPVLRESGNLYMESMNLANVGQVALARGDVRRAAESFQEGLRIAEEITSQWNIANAIGAAGAVAAALRRDSEATQLAGAADAVREATGHPLLPQFRLFSQTVDALRSRLGPDQFQAHWNTGRKTDAATAVAQARDILAAADDSDGHGQDQT